MANAPPNCPYCGSEPVLKEAEEIYGKPYGRVWVCSKWPECSALVSCHRHTSRPMGTLANSELRKLRHRTHEVFDYWWQAYTTWQRPKAYSVLAHAMGMTRKECHIGLMNEQQCKRVIELCTREDKYIGKEQVSEGREGEAADV